MFIKYYRRTADDAHSIRLLGQLQISPLCTCHRDTLDSSRRVDHDSKQTCTSIRSQMATFQPTQTNCPNPREWYFGPMTDADYDFPKG